MKAYQIQEKKNIRKISIKEPHLNNEEILLKIKYLGLCGSDLKTFNGENPLVKYPIIPGHEISGEIIDIGSNVPNRFSVGDFATVIPYDGCGECIACKKGRPNCCRFNKTLGIAQPGAAVERLSIHYSKAIKIERITYRDVVFIEPFSIGYHAVKRGGIKRKQKVIVIGCGLIGIGSIFFAATKGAEVIAVDIDDEKLDLAKNYGAKYIVNINKGNIEEKIQDITKNEGADVVIEAVGDPSTQKQCIELVCFSGTVVYIGYSNKEMILMAKDITYKEIDLKGSRNATIEDMKNVIHLLESNKIDFSPLITKIFAMKDMQEAFIYWNENRKKVTKIILEQ